MILTCRFLLLSVVNLIALVSFAQRLPTTQNTSVKAPRNIKIDGMLNEWSGKFEAYNPGNQISYSVSNDDRNLYLAISTNDAISTDKILYGGITFTISDQASEKNSISISYPLSDYAKNFPVVRMTSSYIKEANENPGNKKRKDSLVALVNKGFANVFKQIAVAGIAEINEPTISIYNTDEIQAATKLNSDLSIGMELCISLKHLKTKPALIKYNLKLNGRRMPPPNPNAPLAPQAVNNAVDNSNLFTDTASGLSGNYTLAK